MGVGGVRGNVIDLVRKCARAVASWQRKHKNSAEEEEVKQVKAICHRVLIGNTHLL